MSVRLRAGLPLALAVLACTEPVGDPNQDLADSVAVSAAGGRSAGRTAAVHWSGVASDLARERVAGSPEIIRGFAILGVAQYGAAITAERRRTRNVHPSVRAAVSAASAEVLAYLFPDAVNESTVPLELFLDPDDRRRQRENREAGESIGRDVAARVIEWAQSDRFLDPWTGTVPVGPGLWFSSSDPPAPPAGAAWGMARPILLRSGDQFRLPPPPSFGSEAFLEGLAEVRRIFETRTPEQDSIARFWSFVPGTDPGPTYWYDVAGDLAVRYSLGEAEAAHLFALMNATAFDALIASHDSKYTYWFIRPSQADPAIELAIGLPNHPSYPSNHGAISSASAGILGAQFPRERRRLDGLADEAALSRVYAGIHYRFDGDAGLQLGRRVAAWALKVDERFHKEGVEWLMSGRQE
jgi:membrane-associated phospholipid phosphatase